MDFNDVRDLARRSFLLDVPNDDADLSLFEAKGQAKVVHSPYELGASIGDAVCTIGAFDGVHRGHRFLFNATREDARRRGVPSVIVTFDPDPDELFLPTERVHKLLNNEDRVSYLAKFGTDFVLSLPFTRELASHNTEEFMRDYISPMFNPCGIHVGTDFKLGAGNEGDVHALRKLGKRRGYKNEVFGYDLLCNRSEPVSATRIRRLLMEKGDCAAANHLLQRAHFVRGRVEKGRQKGREFGFPTANVALDYPYVVPAEGVYGCLVLVGDTVWPAAVNVGVPRTFAGEANCASIEANLLGFSDDIYGEVVSVAFVEHLRGQQAFPSIEELMAMVNSNIDWVRVNLGATGFKL